MYAAASLVASCSPSMSALAMNPAAKPAALPTEAGIMKSARRTGRASARATERLRGGRYWTWAGHQRLQVRPLLRLAACAVLCGDEFPLANHRFGRRVAPFESGGPGRDNAHTARALARRLSRPIF